MDEEAVLTASDDSRVVTRREPVISSATRWAGAIMLAVLAGLATLDYLSWSGTLGDWRDLALGALTLVPLAVAALVLSVARSFGAGAIRRQWSLLGFGMLSVGVGNVVFIVLYLVTGSDPYPSFADVFTLSGYMLFAVGLFSAVRAYRGLLDVRPPLAIATAVSAAGMALVYFTVIGPYVIFPETATQNLVTRVLNTLYFVLDAFVLLLPSIALGLLVLRLGSGRVAWPWWLVASSAGILAVTDTVFAYAGYSGLGRTPWIDVGYGLAPLMLAFAVLVARDIYRS